MTGPPSHPGGRTSTSCIVGCMGLGSASSPQLLRHMNSGALMRFALRSPEFTAAEAMEQTALTRSTVPGVCDDLVAVGWLAEIADRSEEHTSELQSLMRISYAVFCLKKKKC